MKNVKNLLMMLAMMLPVIAFAKPANDYMLNTGTKLKVGDVVKCGIGSLIGKEYAHIYRVTEKGQESLDANAAGSMMTVKSINVMDRKIMLEDSKHVDYICEIDFAIQNAELLTVVQPHKANTTLDNIKLATKSNARPSLVNNEVLNHMGSVLQRMNGNGTLTNGETAALTKMINRK